MKFAVRGLATLATASMIALGIVASADAAGHGGIPTKVKLSDKFPAFHGKVKSDSDACVSNRKIRLFKVKKGDDKVIGKTRTDSMGKWQIIKTEKPGAYYAKANKSSPSSGVTCKSAVSKTVAID